MYKQVHALHVAFACLLVAPCSQAPVRACVCACVHVCHVQHLASLVSSTPVVSESVGVDASVAGPLGGLGGLAALLPDAKPLDTDWTRLDKDATPTVTSSSPPAASAPAPSPPVPAPAPSPSGLLSTAMAPDVPPHTSSPARTALTAKPVQRPASGGLGAKKLTTAPTAVRGFVTVRVYVYVRARMCVYSTAVMLSLLQKKLGATKLGATPVPSGKVSLFLSSAVPLSIVTHCAECACAVCAGRI